MPIDDFFQVTPVPPLGVEDLGVSPLGEPPAPPQIGRTPEEEKKRKLLLVATLIGSALGGRKTAGFGEGMLQGLRQQDQQRMLDERVAQQQYGQASTIYAQQQRQQEQDAERRRQTLMTNVESLRKTVPSLTSKADYERYVTAYTQGLQQLGFRLDTNWLRQSVPYVAPGAEKRAAEAIAAWKTIPNNARTLTEHPEIAYASKVPFDRDGDGPEALNDVTLEELFALSGAHPAKDAEGKLIFSAPGTTLEAKANADGILQDLIAQSLADGKRQTPTLMADLRVQAMRLAKEASDLGPDPLVNAIREQTLANMQKGGTSKPSTGLQKRALNFFNRAKQAETDLESIEGQVASMGRAGQAYMSLAPNFAQTSTGQLYNQAQRAFTEARLRKDSGAAIHSDEYANDRKTYFVEPGDLPPRIAQKKRARAAVLASLAFETGSALHEFYGEEATDILEGYKTQSQDTGSAGGQHDPLGVR